MITAECIMDKDLFYNHMVNKHLQWKPKHTHIGNDFAVFEFPYPYARTQAVDSLKHYAAYYGYRYLEGPDRHSMVIINGAGEIPYDL